MHHLEHEPPSIISSSIRSFGNVGNPDDSFRECLYMDVLVCGRRFGYPLLHSIKMGDEATPVVVTLPQAVHGLRAANQQKNGSSALHPDGAQSAAFTTSGMCLLTNSLPAGVRTVAFFASFNGNIWFSCVSDRADALEARDLACHQRNIAAGSSSIPSATDVAVRTMVGRSQIDPSEFRRWMAIPRTPPLHCPCSLLIPLARYCRRNHRI
jgi:hypothetical protein